MRVLGFAYMCACLYFSAINALVATHFRSQFSRKNAANMSHESPCCGKDQDAKMWTLQSLMAWQCTVGLTSMADGSKHIPLKAMVCKPV